MLAFGAFAGAVADRVDRRSLVIAAEVTNVLASATVAALLIGGWLEYWHLAAANVVLGFAWAIEWPSRRAMLPDLTGRDLLVPSVALDTQSMNANKVLGPVLGGAMLASLGVAGCYVLLAVVYAVGIAPLLGLRLPASSRVRVASPLRFVLEGLSYCHQNVPVRGVLLITVVMNCMAFPYVQLLSVFARDVLQVGPVGLGLLASGDGIGSLIGTSLLMRPSSRWAARPIEDGRKGGAPVGARAWLAVHRLFGSHLRRHGWVFVVGSASMCVALAVFALSPLYALSLAALIVGGIGHSGFSTFQTTIILSSVAESLRGRAMGVLTLAIGSAPLGMLFMGAVAAALSAPAAVAISATLGGLLIGGSVAAAPGLLAYQPSAIGSVDRPRAEGIAASQALKDSSSGWRAAVSNEE